MSAIGELIPDKDYSAMWRVRMQDGELSDMVNKQRATELARLLIDEQRRVKQRSPYERA